ncbi:MAG: hypothetical protein JXK16_02905 [Thiotrichales bacterium]|nr:hypothetical protein [Thiotrichales bacterium]
MRHKFKLTAIAAAIFMLSGCSHIAEHTKISETVVNPTDVIDEIAASIKDKSAEKSNSEYFHYTMNLDESDIDDTVFTDELRYTVNINGSIDVAMEYLAKNLSHVNFVFDLDNPGYMDKAIRLNLKDVTMRELITTIESVSGLDLYFQNSRTIVVSDFMVVEGSLSKYEGAQNGSYGAIKEHLKSVLATKGVEGLSPAPIERSSASVPVANPGTNPGTNPVEPPLPAGQNAPEDKLFTEIFQGQGYSPLPSLPASQTMKEVEPEVIIDEATGALRIKANPKRLRESKKMIEDYINASVSFANVEMSIYRINNNKARDVGISVNKIIDNLYTLAAGTEASAMASKSIEFNRSVTDKNGDVLSAGINLYEKHGLLNSESSTVLTVYNNVPTTMSDIQSTGYWIPGALKENTTAINGVSVTTFSEDKPEFIDDEVGNRLTFTPRINLGEKQINMQIAFSDSKIYQTEVFTWKRNLSLEDSVEIKKPLKTENKIDAILTLNRDKYSLFAGVKSKEGELSRQFIPGLGDVPILQDVGVNKSSGNRSDTLFVVKANFPDKRIEQSMVKKKLEVKND